MIEKRNLTLRNGTGGMLKTVPVEVYGFFGVHKNPESTKGWIVTHLQTGIKCMPRGVPGVFKDKFYAIYAALRLSCFPSLFNFTWEEYKTSGWQPPNAQAALSTAVDIECELKVLKGEYVMEVKPILNEILPNRMESDGYPEM